jgi:hypothetical protein
MAGSIAGPSGLGGWAVQPAYLYDLDAEQLQPEQQPGECCLVRERAVQHGLDRLHCGFQPFEINERLGWEDSRNAYFVIASCHPPARPSVVKRPASL